MCIANRARGLYLHFHLPEHQETITSLESDINAPITFKGNETILLVEDEALLLNLGSEILEQMGFNVLATYSPNEALRIAAEHPGEIQVLMTDVIMPEMNGQELAGRLVKEYPGIRCLFVSGYTTDVFSPEGVLEQGVHFLQKPYTKNDLEKMLQKVLS